MAKHFRFSNLDYIIYFDKILSNFIHNIEIRGSNNIDYIDYIISDQDTPEIIAYKLYGDSSLSWIILWLNNRIDPFYDWPLAQQAFDDYLDNKYGDDLYLTHHYENDGYVVNSDIEGATSISNYQYESTINDEKRKIKLVTTEIMSLIIDAIS